MNEIVTYPECFQKYPDKWILLEVVERDNGRVITKGKVIDTSINKQEILDTARGMRASDMDVCVVCTIESLEEALSFVAFDNNFKQQDYVSCKEYAEIFNMYYGLIYNGIVG